MREEETENPFDEFKASILVVLIGKINGEGIYVNS